MSTLFRLDPEHFREQPRRVDLRDVGQVGDKAYRIPAFLACGEVSPTTVVSIDLERSEMAIGAARVERDNLFADPLSAGQEARQYRRERGQRRAVDSVEVDGAGHWRALPRLENAARTRGSTPRAPMPIDDEGPLRSPRRHVKRPLRLANP